VGQETKLLPYWNEAGTRQEAKLLPYWNEAGANRVSWRNRLSPVIIGR
jgi:hypothetical protein